MRTVPAVIATFAPFASVAGVASAAFDSNALLESIHGHTVAVGLWRGVPKTRTIEFDVGEIPLLLRRIVGRGTRVSALQTVTAWSPKHVQVQSRTSFSRVSIDSTFDIYPNKNGRVVFAARATVHARLPSVLQDLAERIACARARTKLEQYVDALLQHGVLQK